MGEVLNLPSTRDRDWREMERAMREVVASVPGLVPKIDSLMPLLRQAFDDIFVEGFLPMPAHDLSSLNADQAALVLRHQVALQDAFTVHVRSIRTAAYIVLFRSVLQAAAPHRCVDAP